MPERKFENKMVIVARKDLHLSPGKLAAQVAHAAVLCAVEAKEKDFPHYDAWIAEGYKKVVVAVQSEEEMQKVYKDAKQAGLITSYIVDAGMTEIPPNTATCIAIGPAINEKIDRVTFNLKLY